jgi:predicted DNA-binding transcriptional regulator AlpA
MKKISNVKVKFIKKKDVVEMTTFSKSTIERKIANGLMPPPFKSSSLGRGVVFFEHEIQEVMLEIGKGSDDSKIKNLVSSLVKERQQ